MSTHTQVEELPNNFDKLLDLNKPLPKPSASPTSGPLLQIPTRSKAEVIDGLVKIYVVPGSKSKEFTSIHFR